MYISLNPWSCGKEPGPQGVRSLECRHGSRSSWAPGHTFRPLPQPAEPALSAERVRFRCVAPIIILIIILIIVVIIINNNLIFNNDNNYHSNNNKKKQ